MKNAFVIMPFSSTTTFTEDQWTEIFDSVFQPAIEECGYVCQRSMPMTGSLPQSIIEQLRYSQIVLADITDRNPNVFYELGIRHCLRKGTIVVSYDVKHLPSDLRGYWFIKYGIRPREVVQFKAEIRRLITAIEKNPQKSDNPVADYLEKEHFMISSFAQTENIKKLGALYTELSGNLLGLAELLRNPNLEAFLSYDCLSFFIQTHYVDVGPDLLKIAYELHYKLLRIERGNRDSQLLNDAINECTSFGNTILDIKSKIGLDQFKEPSVVTTMIWKAQIASATDETRIGRLSHLAQTSSSTIYETATDILTRTCQTAVETFHVNHEGTGLFNSNKINDLDDLSLAFVPEPRPTKRASKPLKTSKKTTHNRARKSKGIRPVKGH